MAKEFRFNLSTADYFMDKHMPNTNAESHLRTENVRLRAVLDHLVKAIRLGVGLADAARKAEKVLAETVKG